MHSSLCCVSLLENYSPFFLSNSYKFCFRLQIWAFGGHRKVVWVVGICSSSEPDVFTLLDYGSGNLFQKINSPSTVCSCTTMYSLWEFELDKPFVSFATFYSQFPRLLFFICLSQLTISYSLLWGISYLLKLYCCVWIVDFAKLRGERKFLDEWKGEYNEVASFFLGATK